MTLLVESPWWAAPIVAVILALLASPVLTARIQQRQDAQLQRIETKADTAVEHVANSHGTNLRDDIDELRSNVDDLQVDVNGMAMTLRSIDEHLRVLADQDRSTGDRITEIDRRVTQVVGRVSGMSERVRRIEQRPE